MPSKVLVGGIVPKYTIDSCSLRGLVMSKVTPLNARDRDHVLPDEMWLRRQAMLIASQLPERPQEALAILSLTEKLVREFWVDSQPKQI
jgi:hypothetical protein